MRAFYGKKVKDRQRLAEFERIMAANFKFSSMNLKNFKRLKY